MSEDSKVSNSGEQKSLSSEIADLNEQLADVKSILASQASLQSLLIADVAALTEASDALKQLKLDDDFDVEQLPSTEEMSRILGELSGDIEGFRSFVTSQVEQLRSAAEATISEEKGALTAYASLYELLSLAEQEKTQLEAVLLKLRGVVPSLAKFESRLEDFEQRLGALEGATSSTKRIDRATDIVSASASAIVAAASVAAATQGSRRGACSVL